MEKPKQPISIRKFSIITENLNYLWLVQIYGRCNNKDQAEGFLVVP